MTGVGETGELDVESRSVRKGPKDRFLVKRVPVT